MTGLDYLAAADTWRWIAAVASVLVLFLLVVGVVLHSDAMPRPWRRVLWAIVAEQAVLAYLEVSRAHSTPPGYPEIVDAPLVALTLSALAILTTILVVVFHERRKATP